MSDTTHWADVDEWWQHPATAYMKGLVDGAVLERERLARIAADNLEDAAWREAVRRAVRIVEVGDARARSDQRRSA